MAQSGQRKCLCCQLFFDVDRRIGERQRYCPKPDCQRASKTKVNKDIAKAMSLLRGQRDFYAQVEAELGRLELLEAARAEGHGEEGGALRKKGLADRTDIV